MHLGILVAREKVGCGIVVENVTRIQFMRMATGWSKEELVYNMKCYFVALHEINHN